MRLIWKLPDNDGGERIKSYFIEKKCVTDKAWTKVSSPAHVFNSHFFGGVGVLQQIT